MTIEFTFVGCGDAFGSGGRLNTCFHVAGAGTAFLIDCGASSLIGLKRLKIDPNGIRTILITHFHADHFGGLPFFILDARFFAKRTGPLTLVGPAGLREAYAQYMETSFVGSTSTDFAFGLEFIELLPGEERQVNGLSVYAERVNHGREGGPYFAYRVGVDGRTVAYTGDTEWTETLVPIGRDVDLFVAEAYFKDREVKLHLDVATLERHLPRLKPKRLILTHMSEDMLGRLEEVPYEAAHDGLVVQV